MSEPIQYNQMLDRGKLDDIRRGDDSPMTVDFEGKFTRFISNSAGPVDETYTIHEMLRGVSRKNDSSFGKPMFAGTREPWLEAFGCPPYCVDLEVHDNPVLECPDSEALGEASLIRYFRANSIQADFNIGMVSISGSAHVLFPINDRVGGPDSTAAKKFNYSDIEDAEPLDVANPSFWVADPRDIT